MGGIMSPGYSPAQGVAAGAAAMSRWTADIALSGQRVVRALDRYRLAYPRLNVLEHGDAIVGVTVGAAAAGAPCAVREDGEVSDPAWSWRPGPIFCGDNGVLTQDPPDGSWSRQVGTAVSPTTMLVELFPTYIRRL